MSTACNAHNQQVVTRLTAAIAAFHDGALELGEVHSALESALALLENDGSNVRDVVRGAVADVEEVRFTRLRDEQRPEVAVRLDALLDDLDSASEG
jgi:hypothetical protein